MTKNITRKQFDSISRKDRLEVAARLTAFEYAYSNPARCAEMLENNYNLLANVRLTLSKYTDDQLNTIGANVADKLIKMGFTQAELEKILIA